MLSDPGAGPGESAGAARFAWQPGRRRVPAGSSPVGEPVPELILETGPFLLVLLLVPVVLL